MPSEAENAGMSFLGIDVGGSATRWAVRTGRQLLTGVCDGASGHLQRPEVRVQVEHVLREIVARTGPVSVIVAGVTGLSARSAEAGQLSEMLHRQFDAGHIHVMSDIELAHRTAFPDQAGILVYAGTGSIAAFRTADDAVLTVGGKGVVIDDAGGGFWIGIQAMRAVLRSEDRKPGSGWASPLGRTLASHFPATDWPSVRSHFHALDRGGVGRLALSVKMAAEQEDVIAIDILRQAGHELGMLANVMRDRCGPHPVVLAGRAATMHPAIHSAMTETCGPVALASQREGGAAVAATHLAEAMRHGTDS
jgi:glucosamine kinase